MFGDEGERKSSRSKKASAKRVKYDDIKEDQPQLAEFIRMREESDRRLADESDMSFYVCLVFQSREQKGEFMSQVKVPCLYARYVDGQEFAKQVGINVTPNTISPRKRETLINKRLKELAERSKSVPEDWEGFSDS